MSLIRRTERDDYHGAKLLESRQQWALNGTYAYLVSSFVGNNTNMTTGFTLLYSSRSGLQHQGEPEDYNLGVVLD